jgi:hypothetical protein
MFREERVQLSIDHLGPISAQSYSRTSFHFVVMLGRLEVTLQSCVARTRTTSSIAVRASSRVFR